MPHIYVIHENDAWLEPLAAAFEAQGLPWSSWHLHEGQVDLDATPPRGVFYNRMSASSHTRGHRYAPELTASVIAWLEAAGRRVINGGRSIDFEISKARQYAALRAFGVRIPRTRVAVGREAVLDAARAMGAPLILKPNRGGKGLGVELHRTLDSVDAYVASDAFEPGIDGTLLVQQYVEPAEPMIIRNEFVGGRFLYSVRVDTSRGFELCPADACAIEDLACPVGEAVPKQFEILERFEPPDRERYERFMASAGIEIAGIEMIIDVEGRHHTYDVNTNTNYNAEAEADAKRAGTSGAGMWAVAECLGEALAQELRT